MLPALSFRACAFFFLFFFFLFFLFLFLFLSPGEKKGKKEKRKGKGNHNFLSRRYQSLSFGLEKEAVRGLWDGECEIEI